MAKSVRLRAWQKAALEKMLASERNDFLAVATPGAGKTTFSLTAARHHLATNPNHRVIVVVPTQHLKVQWAVAALGFDLHLEPEWSAANGALPGDMHGIVTTYQQVATNAETLSRLSQDAFVVLDEIHHAGDDRAWGDAIRVAFKNSAQRLSVSGTPFRSDTNSIPFVEYSGDEAVPDFEYGYGEALKDRGVVRPVYFPRIDGEMEWTAPDGTYNAARFSDDLDIVRSGQRLRTALALDGQWLPAVLTQAHKQLLDIRKTHPEAGGLVIAMDQGHAKGIATMLKTRFGVKATVAVSEDPLASSRIAQFSAATSPWIVAVRMVSEGVDIPRLRVGVFATNTTTDLFFRQAIGRLVRHTRGLGRQKAYMFIPDDARLRVKANEIAVHRRHSLRKQVREEEDVDLFADPMDKLEGPKDEAQPSMFAAISSWAEEEVIIDSLDLTNEDTADTEAPEDESLVIELAPPPPLQGGTGVSASTATRAEYKRDLRSRNADKVRDLAQITGMTYAAINVELNKQSGIKKITEATVVQLERRVTAAEHWLVRLSGKK